jgi:hypothetical protein
VIDFLLNRLEIVGRCNRMVYLAGQSSSDPRTGNSAVGLPRTGVVSIPQRAANGPN